MSQQHTIGSPVTLRGAGLHTGLACTVTLHPAAAGSGRRIVGPAPPRRAVAMSWENRIPSVMSTTIALGGGRAVRTVEHLMAGLSALGVDNVLVEVDGPEIPILDGSARRWCAALAAAGLAPQGVPRRAVRVLRPVQVWHQGGFLRIEPAETGSIDMTYDLLPGFPVMRWTGAIDRATFLTELQASRSFGVFTWPSLRGAPPRRRRPHPDDVAPNRPDPGLMTFTEDDLVRHAPQQPAAPLLRGARPGRAALVVGRGVLPWPRYRQEPLRHVVLDMIGDLALADAPLLGRVVAHNPSHEKTYMLVAALMRDPTAWAAAEAPPALPPSSRS